MRSTVELIRAVQKERTLLKRRKLLEERVELQIKAVRTADQLAVLEARLVRLNEPFPIADICPICYFRLGTRNVFVPDTHPDPDRYVRMTCRACGFEDDRPAE